MIVDLPLIYLNKKWWLSIFFVGLLEGNSIHGPLMSIGPNGICLVCLSRHRLFGAWFGRRWVWCVLRFKRRRNRSFFQTWYWDIQRVLHWEYNIYIYIYIYQHWLVVSTPLKHISQMGVLFPIYGKINKWSKPPTRTYYIILLHGAGIFTLTCPPKLSKTCPKTWKFPAVMIPPHGPVFPEPVRPVRQVLSEAFQSILQAPQNPGRWGFPGPVIPGVLSS